MTLTGSEIVTIIASSVLGGAGVVGLLFALIRGYIERKITKASANAEEQKKRAIKKKIIDEEWEQAVGRLLFWIVRAIETGQHNGELHEAHERFKEVEQKAKDYDREIIANHSSE